MGYVTNQNQ